MIGKSKKIAVVTVGRSDFGIYRPILRRMMDDPALEPSLIVTGGHLDEKTGRTVSFIEEEGWPIAAQVPVDNVPDTADGVVRLMGSILHGMSEALVKCMPDMMLVLGDRYDMFAAALAAVPFNIPIAHIHGGELTEGAIDDQFRHALTKMSHLHFAATNEYARRIIQMGEEPWRVTVCGAPGLDNINEMDWLDRAALSETLQLELTRDPLLVTYHPVTRQWDHTNEQIDVLLDALADVDHPLIFTYPNTDMGNRKIIDAIQRFAGKRVNTIAVSNLGTRRYFSLMKIAAALVGNSSSGIIEAASFGLPVVNVGVRQQGRTQGRNVINTPDEVDSIRAALQQALSSGFREDLRGMENPYGDGHAAERIAECLKEVCITPEFMRKVFTLCERVEQVLRES